MKTCSIEGCEKPVKARGWCGNHYQLWRKNGDPLVRRNNYGVKRNLMSNGYVRVWCPGHPVAQKDGYALEHRKVWFEAHGEIPAGHDIHHLNEDRADNRLENLELKSHRGHWREHLEERGEVTNQYGTWPLRASRLPSSAWAATR
jgi:hypothetical protein